MKELVKLAVSRNKVTNNQKRNLWNLAPKFKAITFKVWSDFVSLRVTF